MGSPSKDLKDATWVRLSTSDSRLRFVLVPMVESIGKILDRLASRIRNLESHNDDELKEWVRTEVRQQIARRLGDE